MITGNLSVAGSARRSRSNANPSMPSAGELDDGRDSVLQEPCWPATARWMAWKSVSSSVTRASHRSNDWARAVRASWRQRSAIEVTPIIATLPCIEWATWYVASPSRRPIASRSAINWLAVSRRNTSSTCAANPGDPVASSPRNWSRISFSSFDAGSPGDNVVSLVTRLPDRSA